MADTRQAWGVRAHPHHNNRIAEFLRGDMVALGWPGLGSLAGMDLEHIRRLVKRVYKIREPGEIGRNAGPLDTLVNRVSPGDYVVVPSPEDGAVYIGEFRGNYRYARSKEHDGYPHQRAVRWLFDQARIPRRELPSAVIRALRAQQPIFSIDRAALAEFVDNRMRTDIDVNTDELFSAPEGRLSAVMTKRAERDPDLRKRKIADALASGGGRLICEVPGCGFDFEAVYGKLGWHFAIVHHRKQLASPAGERLTSLKDLAIVCANCHAMIHRHCCCRSMDGLIPNGVASQTAAERVERIT